jgi:O-antigen/teichoic acid export membrane protein
MHWLQGQFSIMLLFTMDLILMGILFGPGPAAVYGVVTRVTTMSRQVIQALCDTAWPKLAQQPDLERKAELMRKVDRLNAWIAGAWYGAMLATLHPFLSWLVKPDWVAGTLLIGLMIARNLIVSLAAPHSYGLLSAGRFKELARFTQSEILCSIIAIFLFSHFFGMIGLAIGVLAGTAGGSLWYTTYLYFHKAKHTIWFSEWCAVYARGSASAFISFGIASLVWWGELALFHAPGWAAVLAGGLGFGAGITVAIFFGLSRGDGTNTVTNRWIKLPNRW